MDPDHLTRRASAVTLSDTVDLPLPSRGLWIGVTGDVKVSLVGSGVVTFKSVPVGWLFVEAKRVWATGTTATDLVASLRPS